MTRGGGRYTGRDLTGDEVCHCGRPARGDVAATADVPAHFCRQCSPKHCALGTYLRLRHTQPPVAGVPGQLAIDDGEATQ